MNEIIEFDEWNEAIIEFAENIRNQLSIYSPYLKFDVEKRYYIFDKAFNLQEYIISYFRNEDRKLRNFLDDIDEEIIIEEDEILIFILKEIKKAFLKMNDFATLSIKKIQERNEKRKNGIFDDE